MQIQNALINLSLVLVLIFTLAFKCGNDSDDNPTPPDNKRQINSGELTETIVKQIVTQREEMLATGAGGSPDSVTVTFENIDFGTSRIANKQDEFNGIPNGETVYPARVRYTAHRQRRNGTTEDQEVYYSYDFYVSKYGKWAVLANGPAR